MGLFSRIKSLYSLALKYVNRNEYNKYLERTVDYDHQRVYNCSTGEAIVGMASKLEEKVNNG
jgi:hypothetical protein